jgi:F-type H+-transporting ATPase subunit delta
MIMHAFIAVAVAKDFMANYNGIEQNLMDRSKSMSLNGANMDALTLGKPLAGVNVRSPGTMNRLPVAMNRLQSQRVSAGLAEETVAGRYAQGLYEVAEKKKEVDTLMQTVASLQLTLNEAPELAQMLSNPVIPTEQKTQLIDKILEKGTMNTMCNYLVDKQRIDVLPEIVGNFELLYNEKNKIEKIQVKSACPLTEDQLSQIGETVKGRTGAKSVKIAESIDESLIGGFIVSYGGQQIDLSIRSSLDAVRRELMPSSAL